VSKPKVKIERVKAAIVHSITSEQTPRDALEEFCDITGGAYAERKESLLALHDEMVEEAGA